MKSSNIFQAWTVAVLLAGPGCRSALPTFSAMSGQEALAVMRERNAAIVCISSPCRVVLADEKGRSVALDGALVAARDGHLRLRAWKLSRAVFDLILTPDGAWLWESDSREVDGASRLHQETTWANGRLADYFDAFWAITVGDFDQSWQLVEARPGELQILKRHADGTSLECSIEGRTLTVSSCRDSGDMSTAYIRLSGHRRFGAMVIPTSIDAHAAGHQFTVYLDDPVLDEEPAPQAFVPPSGAVSLR